MIICKCDRCGKETVMKNFLSSFGGLNEKEGPRYSIVRINGKETQSVNLCRECEDAIDCFLGGVSRCVYRCDDGKCEKRSTLASVEYCVEGPCPYQEEQE